MRCQGCITAHVWRPEGYSWELILSFLHVGPWDQPQIICLGDKCFYLLSYLADPVLNPFVRILCFYGGVSLLIISLHMPLCSLCTVSYPFSSTCHTHCIHGDAEHRKWVPLSANEQMDEPGISSEASDRTWLQGCRKVISAKSLREVCFQGGTQLNLY